MTWLFSELEKADTSEIRSVSDGDLVGERLIMDM